MKRVFTVLPFIVIALILSVIGCQHDDTPLQTEQAELQEPKFIVKMKSGDHLRNINPTIYQRLAETSRHTGSLNTTEDETGATSFTLDLSTVQIIERNTYTQYTTSIFDHADYETYLINYMLLDFNDGAQYQFLIKYPRIVTDQGAEIDRSNAVVERIEGNTLLQTESGIGSPRPCLEGVPEIVDTVQQYSCTETPCTGNEGHDWGEDCPCADLSYCTMPTRACGWNTVNVWGCSGGGISGTGTSGTTGGGNDDPSDDPNDDDPIETVPILTVWEEIENCINSNSFNDNSQLTSQMLLWLQSNNNKRATSIIKTHLDNNLCSEDAQSDVIFFISESIDNIYEWDSINEFWDLYFEDNPQEFLDVVLFESPETDEYATEVDLYSVLPCFDVTNNQSATHEVIIYVDQPIPNSRKPNSGFDAGHSFIEISQTTSGLNSNTVSEVIGFYPRNDATPNNPTSPGAFIDDSEHDYDVKMTVKLTPQQFNNIIAYLNTFVDNDVPQFNLNDFNCTDFAFKIMSYSSVTIPDTPGEWGGIVVAAGSGSCPSNAGEDIRDTEFDTNIATKKTTAGNANTSTENECDDD